MIEEGRAFEIPDVANNELIARLIEQRIALRSQMALEMRTLLPGHPRILELRAQLTDLDDQITASAERTVRILENDARIAASRVESLEAALDAQMSVVAQANESEVQLRARGTGGASRGVKQLENYLTRYREGYCPGLGEMPAWPDARIVSRAIVPNNPVFPRKGADRSAGDFRRALPGDRRRRRLPNWLSAAVRPAQPLPFRQWAARRRKESRTARGPGRRARMGPCAESWHICRRHASRVIPGAARLRFRLPWATM